MSRLFGTDGVRGVVGETLTGDLARDLGRAAATVLIRHGQTRPQFVVGRDTRASGGMLEDAMGEGIRSAGGEILRVGIVPTPAVAFLAAELDAAGVVISASHNPAEYNGIKLFASSGYKLPDSLEDEIQAEMSHTPGEAEEGSETLLPEALERYLHHLTDRGDRLDGMKIVVDCANGAASAPAPEVYRRLGAEVVVMNDSPDGVNINQGCGALHPEVVAAEVVRVGADAGIAHDGDADRALFADAVGNVIDGDQVLVACAMDLKERGLLDNDTVVTTVMANIGLRLALADAGIRVVTSRVGDRYVLEDMLRTGAVLGGEQSGHVIFADCATTGDGLLTAVRFLSTSVRTGVPVSDLAAKMERFPQVMVNVRVSDGAALDGAGSVWEAAGQAERELGEQGRILIRASGTEPLVRVMVEAPTEASARAHAERIAERVRHELGVPEG
jgi:phosphoglucosamine mutase